MALSKKTVYKKTKGISLVEIILAVGILGFISLMVASIYLAYFHLFSDQNTRIETDTQSRQTLSDMIRNTRQSYTVDSTATNQILVLDLWPLDPSGNPYDPGCICYDQITYKLDPADNTHLIIIGSHNINAASSRVIPAQRTLTTNVTSLGFTYDNADLTIARQVTINLTITKASGGKTYTSDQTEKVALRNK